MTLSYTPDLRFYLGFISIVSAAAPFYMAHLKQNGEPIRVGHLFVATAIAGCAFAIGQLHLQVRAGATSGYLLLAGSLIAVTSGVVSQTLLFAESRGRTTSVVRREEATKQ